MKRSIVISIVFVLLLVGVVGAVWVYRSTQTQQAEKQYPQYTNQNAPGNQANQAPAAATKTAPRVSANDLESELQAGMDDGGIGDFELLKAGINAF